MCDDEIPCTGMSLLHYAAVRGEVAFIKTLLEAGVDPNDRMKTSTRVDLVGCMPLHLAVCSVKRDRKKAEEAVRVLLAYGADASAIAYSGITPLHCASAQPLGIEIVKMLVEAGADLHSATKSGSKPSAVAATREIADFIAACVEIEECVLSL